MGFLFGQQSIFADKRIRKKREIDITSPEYKKMLKRLIHNRYDSKILRDIAFEKEYQKYLKEEKDKKQWKRFEEVI